jgi:hypothetical protein
MQFKAKHQHKYYEVAVYHPSPSFAALLGSTIGVAFTVVLLRCECGDLDTRALNGNWSLAQVRGHADLDSIQELELSLR